MQDVISESGVEATEPGKEQMPLIGRVSLNLEADGKQLPTDESTLIRLLSC